jgi:copper transport protein
MMESGSQRWHAIHLLLLLGLVAMSPLVLVQSVSAHANLLWAAPEPNTVLQQPPARITLGFSERIAPGFSAIQVLDTQSRRVDNDDSTVDQEATALAVTLQPLPHGLYTVAWKNVSTVDGHRVQGSFVFAVGESIRSGLGTAPALPLLQSASAPVLRWLVLLSALVVVGGLGFILLVCRALLMQSATHDSVRPVGTQVVARTRQHIWIAMGVLLLASVGQLLDHTAVAAELPFYKALGRPLVTVLTGTDWGHLWLGRLGLMVLMAMVLAVQRPAKKRADEDRGAWPRSILWAMLLGGILLLTLSLASHGAATLEIRAAAICADYLHLLAAAFWGGGLLHFALGLSQGLRTVSPEVRHAVLTALVPRFSLMASLCVSTMLITGGYSTWAQVTILPALRTLYGVTLLIKLAMVLPLLGLGALNLLWVRPRLARQDTAQHWHPPLGGRLAPSRGPVRRDLSPCGRSQDIHWPARGGLWSAVWGRGAGLPRDLAVHRDGSTSPRTQSVSPNCRVRGNGAAALHSALHALSRPNRSRQWAASSRPAPTTR